jgi:hypothetical protein
MNATNYNIDPWQFPGGKQMARAPGNPNSADHSCADISSTAHQHAPATPVGRIHAIAAGLAAIGVAVGTNGNHLTGLDVTATARPPGRARTEIMLDEDGYAEIRWFTNPAAPPADVTAVLARV